MEKINIINKSEEKINVEVSEVDGIIQLTIDAVPIKKRLSSFAPGEIFSKNGTEYIVCEHFEDGSTAVIRKVCLEEDIEFGVTNNWTESNLRNYLNSKYLEDISDDFGKDNILDHEVDLLSLDGYNDYGSTFDKVSVLTIDRYRRYHKLIKNTNLTNWLSTPDSTPSGTGVSFVQVICDSGHVRWDYSSYGYGVRPFFILKSSISVSWETGE